MRPTDDERITGVVRPEGDSPEATLIERVVPPVPGGAPYDRTERDFQGNEGTVRIEPGSPWAPPPGAGFAPPPPPLNARIAMPEAFPPAASSAPRLPGWVLPYMIGCVTLLLAGLFVLWTQARVLGHL